MSTLSNSPQAERDHKDSLRFYVTVPDSTLPKSNSRLNGLDIADAEKLLKAVKNTRASDGGKMLMNSKIGAWLKANGSSNTTVKEHCLYRKAAGSVPAHWRVGLMITFSNPTLAQQFAKACNIS